MDNFKWIARISGNVGREVGLDKLNGIIEVAFLFHELHPHVSSIFVDEECNVLITMD